MKRIGLIINPVAGMGGSVGLKGSDGEGIQRLARELGAKPEAGNRTRMTLTEMKGIRHQIFLITAPGAMGYDIALEEGFDCESVGMLNNENTSAEDTVRFAKIIAQKGVDLILFAGGDGTARNIYEAISSSIPVLGIPAGVKIHSAVYSVNPKSAGKAVIDLCTKSEVRTKEAEVMDIDEDAFRKGNVRAKLYGYMRIPEIKLYMQSVKAGGYSEKNSVGGLAVEVAEAMEEETLYIVGPGTTTRGIMEYLSLPSTLLGIDAVFRKELIGEDLNEQQIFGLISKYKKTKIIVTVIGGQGHVFGRGNQQLSPRIIRAAGKENIIIVATKSKLVALLPNPLIADTGDLELDNQLSGYQRVITGHGDSMMFPVKA